DGATALSAEGTAFWSASFDLSSLDEGVHSITAVSTDVNGIESPPAMVSFLYDSSGPAVEITSPESGTLATGKVDLEVSVSDLNGMRSVSVQQGAGGAIESLRVREGRVEESFSYQVDTTELQDGPVVLWITAVDTTGSVTRFPFLLIVDNSPPEINLVSPGEETVPAGEMVFAGSLTDEVGVATATYTTSSGEQGELTLTPGDPFWSVPATFTEGRRGSFTLTATDDVGNTAVLEHTVEIDEEADLPRIVSNRVTDGYLIGHAADDDGVSAVEHRLGDGEWTRVETTRTFAVPVPAARPGSYDLEVRAVDVSGRTGPTVEEEITIPAPAPILGELEGPDGSFRPGRIMYEGESLVVAGSVEKAWGAGAVQYSFDGENPSSSRLGDISDDGTADFELTLGSRQAPGRHDLTIRVENEEGEGDTISTFYYVLERLPDEPDPDETYVTGITDDPGLYLADGRLDGGSGGNDGAGGGDRGAAGNRGGRLHFRNTRPLTAFVAGGDIASARLEPEADGFRVSVDGSAVAVTPQAPSRLDGVRLVVETAGGRELRSPSLDLLYDPEAPTLRMLSPEPDQWLSEAGELRVEAADNLDELRVEYAVGDGSFAPLRAGEEGYAASLSVPADEGSTAVVVRATDGAGNSTVVARTVTFDTAAPEFTILTPDAETPVNGEITVIGYVADDGPLSSLRWSADGEEFEDLETRRAFSFPVSLTRYGSGDERPVIEATDRAGNVELREMTFEIAVEEDIPEVSIQLPPTGSVEREDFTISGSAFDDDSVADILASIDGGPYRSVGEGGSFSLPIDVAELGDNGHTVRVKAVDLGGVESEPAKLDFFVSLESPAGTVSYPKLAESVSDRITMTGTASDANGIESVRLSFDNGATFQRAEPDPDAGFEEWSYGLETAILSDGLHAVQVELTDSHGTQSLFSSLITIDNTPPVVDLDLPEDGETYYGSIILSGDVHDNLGLADVEVRLTPAGGGTESDTAAAPTDVVAAEAANDGETASAGGGETAGARPEPFVVSLEPRAGGVVREELDLSTLPAGHYSLSVVATDESNNRSSDSRDISLITDLAEQERIELHAPLAGYDSSGTPVVEGRLVSYRSFERVTVRLDGVSLGTAEVESNGFFSYPLDPDALRAGDYRVDVAAEVPGGENLESPTHEFSYEPLGPWVSIDSHRSGATVSSRPTISGTAGYTFEPPADLEEGSRAYRQAARGYEVERVDVSLDEGASWDEAHGAGEWDYRIETAGVAEGGLPVLVRMTAANGEQAFNRVQLFVDTVPPVVNLELPRDNSRFNDVLLAAGAASDSTELSSVQAILREGSRSRYEVPEFIQGLYGDFHFLGASTWDVGVGLTFFEDNVKLQAQFGQAPPGRFSGTLLGGKLLANVARVPASYFFGPDLDFLSASLALGANFSYFTEEDLVIGGIVGQLEFPIITNEAWRALNSYSLYTEGQLWFISSDIEGGTEAKLSFGLRVQFL
ncbi:MAG: hypothetical protein GVY14_09905, partial [Spirochaetes bacterium]|nr:hypothetical protein [Spirochaetota bacterium]